AEDGIRDRNVTGVQTCALPISLRDDLTIQEQAKVLLHEIGHAEMHNHRTMKDKDKELQTTPIKEYQAEMLAYLVSSTFELDTERSEERRVGKESRSKKREDEEK